MTLSPRLHNYPGRDLEVMAEALNYHHWIADEFSPFLKGRVAEVGAGSGNFSEVLLQKGIQQLTAFEPSSDMHNILRSRMENVAECITINDFFVSRSHEYKEYFDSIAYINVLEHIEDDAEELKHARHALRPDGALLIFVPALQWLYGSLDKQVGHYRRYHKKRLVSLVENAGFRILKVNYIDMAGILPWFLMFRILKMNLKKKQVDYYDRIVIPTMRQVESLLTPPIGKNLLLVARKTEHDVHLSDNVPQK